MIRFVGRRLLWTIPTVFLITFLVFIAIRIGTDPVQSYLRINPRASQKKVQQYKEANGLTGNMVSQYFNWLHHFVTFNWGRSIKGSRPVWPELKAAMANTLVLGTLATAVGVTIGLGIGILSAMRPRSTVRPDHDHHGVRGNLGAALRQCHPPATVLRDHPHPLAGVGQAVAPDVGCLSRGTPRASTRYCDSNT